MKHGIRISYSWGDTEPVIYRATIEDAWKYAKELAIDEAEVTCREWECSVELYLNEEKNRITLRYLYDGSECYYDVF